MKRGTPEAMRLFIALTMALSLSAVGCKDSNDAPSTASKAAAVGDAPQPDEAASKPVPSSFAEKPPAGTVAKCAVSGETFTVDEDTVVAERDGRFYPFCCAGCEDELEVDPAEAAGS